MAEIFDPNNPKYDKHVGKDVCVKYYYSDNGYLSWKDNLYLGSTFAQKYAEEHFKKFFENAKAEYNKGYRTYMQQLFGKNIEYDKFPVSATSTSTKSISIHTNDMAHAFGLPSFNGKSSESKFIRSQLSIFFNGIMTKDGGSFHLKKDSYGKNAEFLPNFSLNLEELDEAKTEEFTKVREKVEEINEQTAKAINDLNINQKNNPTYDSAQELSEKINAIGNIIFGDNNSKEEGLIDLCNKYKNVKGINAYLLNSLLQCSEAYNSLLKFRNELVFSYEISTNSVTTTPFFINWIVSELLDMAKKDSKKLKQLLTSFDNEKAFMSLVTPCIIKINTLFAPNAPLSIITNKVKSLYPDIVASIKNNMNEIYISRKEPTKIEFNKTFEDALVDEELKKSYSPSSDIKNLFQVFCLQENLSLNDDIEYFEAVDLFTSMLSESNEFKTEHWHFLMFNYFYLDQYIDKLSKHVDLLTEEALTSEDEDKITELDEIISKSENELKRLETVKASMEVILSKNINCYNDILYSREKNSVEGLELEIKEFVRCNNPELKGSANAAKYPMLYYFFNSPTMPLYDDVEQYKTFGKRNHKEIDKLLQAKTDKLFETEEMLRRYIFVEDLEMVIQNINSNYGDSISDSDFINLVVEEMIKEYDLPYIFKMMLDSPYMRDKVFKQDFLDSKVTFNWKKVQVKASVASKISSALFETPMVKRIDGKIMSNFVDGASGVKATEDYEKPDEYSIGYVFQLPSEVNSADLIYIEPETDSYTSPQVYGITHLFLNQELSQDTVKVISKIPGKSFDFRDYDIGSGHIVSYGVKKTRKNPTPSRPYSSSFMRRHFFPKTFETFVDDNISPNSRYDGTRAVVIGDIEKETLDRFEVMKSGHQLVVSAEPNVVYLERIKLENRYKDYLHTKLMA